MRFNAPPGWPPVPEGWVPPAGWQPNPNWPPAPEGWQWWIDNETGQTADADDRPDAEDIPRVSISKLDAQLVKAMQWTRRDGADRRREKAVTTANDESGLTSQFTSLGRQVAAFGTILAPGASQVLGLLGAICALENAQSEVLQTIDSNVKLLKEGPFRSGRLMLQEAYRVGEREHEGRRLLAASKDRFFDALPLSASVQEQALVEFHLGLVGLLLGNKDDALHWFTKAYGSSRAVVEALSEEAGDVKVLKSKWSATALTVSYGAVLLVLPFKVRRVMRASRARSALDDYLPFVNAVATCMNSVNAGPAAPTLTITLNPDGGRTLRESAT